MASQRDETTLEEEARRNARGQFVCFADSLILDFRASDLT